MAKELRYFYDPELSGQLPQEETQHVVRVLRLGVGDELHLMDGKGIFYRAEITAATSHKCLYRILEEMPQHRAWKPRLTLAMAPTKLNDRVEWMAEKATEIGVDELSFLDCQFSERHVLKTERVDKIVVSAMKQSHKAWKPEVCPMTSFQQFVTAPREGQKFICHCYSQLDIDGETSTPSCEAQAKPHLMTACDGVQDCTVLIGPEGDFSVEEVRLAQAHGYQSVTLGESRLRTETAALAAVHIMQLKASLKPIY